MWKGFVSDSEKTKIHPIYLASIMPNLKGELSWVVKTDVET
jgi:hypothetical protein